MDDDAIKWFSSSIIFRIDLALNVAILTFLLSGNEEER